MRINIKNYNPATDSSPDADTYRAIPGDPNPGLEGVILIQDDGECRCGCRQPAKRTFRQGHDQRYKGILIRAHLTGTEINLIKGGVIHSGAAGSFAAEHGWEDYLTNADAKYAAQVAKHTSRPVPVKIKVGRWEYDAVVVSETETTITYEYQAKQGKKTVTQKKG